MYFSSTLELLNFSFSVFILKLDCVLWVISAESSCESIEKDHNDHLVSTPKERFFLLGSLKINLVPSFFSMIIHGMNLNVGLWTKKDLNKIRQKSNKLYFDLQSVSFGIFIFLCKTIKAIWVIYLTVIQCQSEWPLSFF